jgi:hypothetical protein
MAVEWHCCNFSQDLTNSKTVIISVIIHHRVLQHGSVDRKVHQGGDQVRIKEPSANEIKESGIGRKTENY